MNTTTINTLRVIAAALSILISVSLPAQNSIIPAPVHVLRPSFTWDSTIFATELPAFALGHQWGPAKLDKVNTALRMNVTADHFGMLDSHLDQLSHLGDGIGDTNYIVWISPLGNLTDTLNADSLIHQFLSPWVGMRWEPAENAGLTRAWNARDDDAWPLSFAAKHHGTIPSSSTDDNYRRFKLTFNSALTYPVKVLDSVEPRNLLFIHRNIGWANPLAHSYGGAEDSTDVRRLQLVVNLRRTDTTDTAIDDSVVISIVVPYQMRWKDHYATATNRDTLTHRMPFDSVPYTTSGHTFDLPNNRGLQVKMCAPSGGFSDSIIITRRMLPLFSDPGEPDITIVAEFRTDVILDDLGDPVEHVLKNGVFNYPKGGDSTGGADSNKRYMAIDSLGIRVWHHGTTTPVAIHSASLLTPQTKHATSGYWDSTWAEQLEDHVDDMATAFSTYNSVTGRTYKTLSFYINDEFDFEELVGMRYRLEFLDRRLTSETGFTGARMREGNFDSEYGAQRAQGFPSRNLWTSGLTMPDRPTVPPYMPYADGGVEWEFHTNTPIPAPFLNLKVGYTWSADNAPYRKYETDLSTPYFGSWTNVSLPYPTSPNYYSTLAYEGYLHTKDAQGGPSLMQENAVYSSMYQTGSWYFKKRRHFWSNFFYHLDPKFGKDSSARYLVYYNKFQPLTGEAVRLGHATSLNLGTRGFMYDKWRHGDYDVPPSSSYPFQAAIMVSRDDYFPGYVTEDSTAFAWDSVSSTVVTPDSLLKSLHLGGDYYTTTDRIRIHDWAPLGTLAAQMQLNRCMSGDSSEKVYVGRVSVRMETKWWHDFVTDTRTIFKFGTDISNAQIFMKTRPIGWFGKGIKNLMNGDSMRLRSWVQAYADTIKVERWTRTSPSDTTLIREAEPLAEQLYDIVLLDISENDTARAIDNCVIAITNRRTSPHLFNTSLPDSVEFISSYDFDTLSRNSRPDLRYQQVGARRFTVPFRYTLELLKPYLLHVRELRPSYDTINVLDTIIPSLGRKFVLDFRPGETRYFRVTRLQATDSVNTGFLAFSTQNKMIAYPVVNEENTGYTDSVRYHIVFHRKDDAEDYNGVWAVYYQRSIPYHGDSVPEVAGLQWEAPIRLSGLTTSSVAETDGLNRTRYFNVNSTEYLGWLDYPEAASKNLCCGFPSIVLRETSPYHPKVFVTYACEDEWADNDHKDKYFHIVENTFIDQAVLSPTGMDANGKSLLICSKNGTHDRGGDTLKSLARYGTPVINAAAGHNMYYAWSARSNNQLLDANEVDLLGAATKADSLDWLTANDAFLTLPNLTITSDTLTLDAGVPRYPSLNVYSNIAQNFPDATLVWQEGVTNPHIRYTRLSQGIGATAIGRYLPTFVAMTYAAGPPASIPVNLINSIAVVGGALPDDDAGMPVVVRSLQADTMMLFERNESYAGLYGYNHETVAWQEFVRTNGRSRIRYSHFIDRIGYSSNELKYWYANTTYGDYVSLFHPVLAPGLVRMDSLHWEGWVNDSTFMTYLDSLHIRWGNLSDSSLVVNYNILGSGSYSTLKVQSDAGNATYWTGFSQFSNLMTQQIMIARMPGVPQPDGITVHSEYLRAGGAWPHLSLRQRENSPEAFRAIRRVLQYTSGVLPAPSLIASAEQFYKEGDDEPLPPAPLGGFEIGLGKITARAVLSDGRSLSFTPVYDDIMPKGYEGSAVFARHSAATSTPVSELVTDVFNVGEVDELKLLTSGLIRENVEVTIEEVDPSSLTTGKDGTVTANRFAESEESFTLAMAEADIEDPEASKSALYYLTSGDEHYYRLRMKYSGNSEVIFREDLNIDPEEVSFEKSNAGDIRVVDLRKMKGTTLGLSADLRIFPNPSTDLVTVIVDGVGLLPTHVPSKSLVLEVVDLIGNVMLRSNVSLGEAVEVAGLPSGIYVARVRVEGAIEATVKASGQFSVVR